MVMVSLQCVIVGKEECSFNVKIDDGANVNKLKDVIKEQSGGLITVPPPTMQLFLAKTDREGWLAVDDATAVVSDDLNHFTLMDPALFVKDPKHFGEGFKPREGQVHVLVVVPASAPVELQTTRWKKAKEMYPVLDFQESTQPFIHIPIKYAEGSGLRVRKDGLQLYLRSELKNEWEALTASVVRSYAIQWIVGPRGTGKSCAAFAFACSMKRGTDWDVLWIDCTKPVGRWLSCILFRGVEKRTCNFELFSVLNSLRKNAIVFVDGYVKDRDDSVLDECRLWRDGDLKCRRLVIVSSMLSTGKDFRPDKFNKIATVVGSSLWSLTTSTPMLLDDSPGEMDILQQFILPSWTLEEYKTALANDAFYEHVRLSFTTDSDAHMSLEERHAVLDAKFLVVGGNARMMFDMTTEEAMRQLRLAMLNITLHAGSFSVVNCLFAWYGGGCSLVSSFVAREIAFLLDFQNLFCSSRNDNDFKREAFTRLVSHCPTISIQLFGLEYGLFEDRVAVGQKRPRI